MPHNLKIAIIDDDNIFTMSVSSILRSGGYEVIEAASGALGLALVAEARPDVVLLDLNLGDMSGTEVCEELRRAMGPQSPLVVLVSGLGMSAQERASAIGRGAAEYLAKPLDREELLVRMAALENLILARKESEILFRSVFRDSPIGKAILGSGGLVEAVNPALCALVGKDPEDLVGGGLAQLLGAGPGEDLARTLGALDQEGGPSPSLELRLRTGGGEEAWVDASLAPIQDRGLPSRRILATFVDQTERRQAEALRLRLAEDLAAKARVNEVLLRELFHRTRNSMQEIMGLLSAEARRQGCEEVRELVERTNGRILAMALVQGRLYEARDLSRIDLADFAADLSASMSSDSPACREGRVGIDLDTKAVVVGVDTAVPFSLVLQELLANALGHAYPGLARGRINVRLGRDGEGWIRLVVEDSGRGLGPGTDFKEGLGLGLVRNIVEEQLRGTFSLEPGQGFRCVAAFPELLLQGNLRTPIRSRDDHGEPS